LRGLARRIPQLDAVTAYEIGMSTATDPQLLIWAAQAGRVIVTHDQATMPTHAAKLMNQGINITGMIIALRNLPLHRVIEDLELIITCSENDGWVNIICHLPL
jgi:hypothetical protein